MKTGSAINFAALAALCGTAGVAGYMSRRRRRERDKAKLQEIIGDIAQEESPLAKQAGISSFVRAAGTKLGNHGLGLIRENAAVGALSNEAQMAYNTMRGLSGMTQRATGLVTPRVGSVV